MKAKRFTVPLLGAQVAIWGKEQSQLWFEPTLHGKLIKGDKHPTVFGYGSTVGKRILDLKKLVSKEFAVQYALERGELAFLSGRVVTDAGVAFLVDDWDANTTDVTNFNFHANGTSSTAEAVGNTALVAEVGTRVSGTKSQPAANQLQTVATISQGATQNIQEHGLLSASTSGTLWDRSVFAAIGVVNGDSIQFTYTLTVNSGG